MAIITKSSDTAVNPLLKRFPIPRHAGVDPASRIGKGKTWAAPAGATRVKRFEIYRYDPDSMALHNSTSTTSISTPADRWSSTR
jgi:succinate dehydrogenase / fumarate reductase iron-sulfur subunit